MTICESREIAWRVVQCFVAETRTEMTLMVSNEAFGTDGGPWRSAQLSDERQQDLGL